MWLQLTCRCIRPVHAASCANYKDASTSVETLIMSCALATILDIPHAKISMRFIISTAIFSKPLDLWAIMFLQCFHETQQFGKPIESADVLCKSLKFSQFIVQRFNTSSPIPAFCLGLTMEQKQVRVKRHVSVRCTHDVLLLRIRFYGLFICFYNEQASR